MTSDHLSIQERAREQAIELVQRRLLKDGLHAANVRAAVLNDEEYAALIARAALDALCEANYHQPDPECNGTGMVRAKDCDCTPMSSMNYSECPHVPDPCPHCAGTGMVDTGIRLTTALGCEQVEGVRANEDRHITGAGIVHDHRETCDQDPPCVPVFVEVPYTEPTP